MILGGPNKSIEITNRRCTCGQASPQDCCRSGPSDEPAAARLRPNLELRVEKLEKLLTKLAADRDKKGDAQPTYAWAAERQTLDG
jgi:hypothetical protein